MAKRFLVDLNLEKNELQNAVIQNLATAPNNPVDGQIYFNTVTHKFNIYNAGTSQWDEMGTSSGSVSSVSISGNDGSLTFNNAGTTATSVVYKIDHTNSITAKTTAGIYPVKIDAAGHITEAGTAFDPSTKQNTLATQTAYSAQGTSTKVPSITTNSLGQVTDITEVNIAYPTVDTAMSDTSTNAVQNNTIKSYVDTAIAGVAGGMTYKGTIGTGGTAGTDLPTTGVKVGDTYKIVSEGTYAGQASKVGDLFIATATTPTWSYVPSGDEQGVTQINTGAGLTGGPITSTGTIALDASGVTAGTYNSVTVDTYGRVTAGTSVTGLAKKVVYTITGDATTTSFTLTNTTGSSDISISVYEVSSGDEVITDVSRSSSSIIIGFAQAPASGVEYKVVVIY